jgi:hypothetical protein
MLFIFDTFGFEISTLANACQQAGFEAFINRPEMGCVRRGFVATGFRE